MKNIASTQSQPIWLLGTPVATVDPESLSETMVSWIRSGERGRLVTFTNVHMVVEALRNKVFQKLLRDTDINCPDGAPVAWYVKRASGRNIRRVSGPDFMPYFCKETAPLHLRHFFYGGAEAVAARAADALREKIPLLQVAGVYTPPYRPLTPEEDAEVVRMINSAKPDVVWVCLGCPKQEIWISDHRDKLDAPVLLAVGQAVDIAAGTKKRAPRVFCAAGLEWFYRLCQEPGRLWKRYLIYNSIFIYHLLTEFLSFPSHHGLSKIPRE